MIQSTDHNLNNPMETLWMDVLPNIDMWTSRITKMISREEYDNIAIKDPNTMYIVTDANGSKMYLGDRLYAPEDKYMGHYFIGMNDRNEYVLYQRYRFNQYEKMVPICRVDDPEKAMDLLHRSNVIDPMNHLRRLIYMQLISYINMETDTNSFIIGVISTMGYREHPGLQRVTELLSALEGIWSFLYAVPPNILEQVRRISDVGEVIADMYLKIYDVLVKYKFFEELRGENFVEAGVTDLKDPVSDIIAIFK